MSDETKVFGYPLKNEAIKTRLKSNFPSSLLTPIEKLTQLVGVSFPLCPRKLRPGDRCRGKREQRGGGRGCISRNQPSPGLLKRCGWGSPRGRGRVVRGEGALFLAVLYRPV